METASCCGAGIISRSLVATRNHGRLVGVVSIAVYTVAIIFMAGMNRLLSNVFLRVLIEFRFATLGAEVYRLPLVFAGGRSLFGIDGHFADRVKNLHDFT